MTTIPTLRWLDPPQGPAVALLDQTLLPAEMSVLVCDDVPALVGAIKRLVVRGAPMLGVAGAFGVALAAQRGDDVAAAADALAAARPTAVNLAWGAARSLAAYEDALRTSAGTSQPDPERLARAAVLAEARSIERADAAASAAMAARGLTLVPNQARVLTHCNTGALVSAGEGTAFAVVAAAHRAGRLRMLWVDETRPLLQGARLTAWEARRAGIPFAVLPDAAAASLFARGAVDIVLVGADRIAADGSVANKVGTYGLAVLARRHGVPFVVVAPASTVDLGAPTGDAIVVEQRPAGEVLSFGGRAVAPEDADAYNPAFDVTPPDLITAIVSECGIAAAPVGPDTLRVLLPGDAPDLRMRLLPFTAVQDHNT
ncbi:MAG TPA: S-methyl-5-thioribose-1-phosphate isomerase [Streptosporangiaceae bacterium]|nr:S-methyl-5-thioribose-1-phosphate isomerase [Streptosporangiaceae bacterium]